MNVAHFYLCPNCKNNHPEFDDARNCCAVITTFVCGDCKERYKIRAKAENCCRKQKHMAHKVQRTHEELRKAFTPNNLQTA
jgi:hypothetical protein